MVEFKKIKVPDGSGGMKEVAPKIAERAVMDVDGREIQTTYATKEELKDGSVKKLGTDTVGSESKPIFLKDGVPTVATNIATLSGNVFTAMQSVDLRSTSYIASSFRIKGNDLSVSDSSPGKWVGMLDIVSADNSVIGGIVLNQSGESRILIMRVFNGENQAQINLVATSDGKQYLRGPTPDSASPSNTYTTKAYVSATDGVTNNLLHTIGNETRESGYINFNGTSQIYDHGRVFAAGMMDQAHFYDYCTVPASGDLRATIEVMTLNDYGIVRINDVNRSVSKVNLVGSILQYVDFEIETVGNQRIIRVKKTTAGDLILNGINININGVRANAKVETDYKPKVVE